jgi:predicted nucleic-acid-binding protein
LNSILGFYDNEYRKQQGAATMSTHHAAQENKQIESRNEHVFNKFTKDGCELYIVSLYVIEMILRVYYVKCCCMRA